MFPSLARMLIVAGLAFVALGVLFLLGARFPLARIGRLPGDIVYRRGNFSFYFPWVTCLLASLLLTLLFWIFGRR